MIITIDGPSGTGKSTVARKVAEKLGFAYCDTGGMFRTIAYGMMKAMVDYTKKDAVLAFLQEHKVELKLIQQKTHFFLNEVDVTAHLRSHAVSDMASKIATLQAVRDELANLQRRVGKNGKTVFEGRDMGTHIFPEADIKFFLTAKPEVRAERRYKELLAKDPSMSLTLEQVLRDVQERDERDSTRDIAPLRPADDAHIIDTSALSIEDVVEKITAIALYQS